MKNMIEIMPEFTFASAASFTWLSRQMSAANRLHKSHRYPHRTAGFAFPLFEKFGEFQMPRKDQTQGAFPGMCPRPIHSL